MPLLERLCRILQQHPSALFTDVDGTIAPIAPSPEEAVCHPGCRESLARLAAKLALVAAVSGRPAEKARQLIGLDRIIYVGNHGLERLEAGRLSLAPQAVAYRPRVQAALAAVRSALSWPGLVFEPKGVTATIHYRLAEHPARARQAILDVLGRTHEARELRIVEGRMVVELRPPVPLDKGTAVLDLIAERGLRAAVCLSDDRTDVDAFMALHDWREARKGLALCVAVASDETPDELLHYADAIVDGVDAVCQLLADVARRISSQ